MNDDSDERTPFWRRARLRVAALALLGSSACAGLSQIGREPASTPRISSTTVTLRGKRLDLHLAVPPRPRAADVLVLYASGDGGWFGAATDMFRATGAAGYYAVGLSTRTLLRLERASGSPKVDNLAADYDEVIAAATSALHLPARPRVVLTGWSRGASLAVLIGGSAHAPPNLAGVVAIGLAADENLAMVSDTDEEPDDEPHVSGAGTLDMYAFLDRLGPRPSVVIQATGDGYLRASHARELFGEDTETRRFIEVGAKNHRFGGGGEEFAAALRSALGWIVDWPSSANP